jgi:polyphosphate glucokinase
MERLRIPTPEPATPQAVAEAIGQIARSFQWSGPIGCGFPAVVRDGIVRTAANIDSTWIGTDAAHLISETTGCPAVVLNDADAAGLAEMRFGAGRGAGGVVLMVTVGTGLGTALFTHGRLVPNSELGHVFLHDMKAEHYASDAVRKRLDLPWEEWGSRFSEYLRHLENLFWPDLIIIGGGASKRFEKFSGSLVLRTPVAPAALLNNAGMIGAAVAAAEAGRSG